MNQERIIILDTDQNTNKGYLDMYPSKPARLNLQVNDLGDIATRNSTFSNTIRVPRTANNEALLEGTGTLFNQSDVPYKEVRCRFLRGNVTIINNGYIKLAKTTASEYHIVIFDGLVDFVSAIDTKKISDLDLSDMTHTLSGQVFIDSHASNTGYVYGMGQYGLFVNTVQEITEMGVSVYAHEIWDRVFQEAGMTYTGDFFDTNTDWKELVVTPSKGVTYTEAAFTSTAIGTASTDSQNISEFPSSQFTGEHEHNITSNTFGADLSVNGDGDIVVNYDGTLELEVTATYTIVHESTTASLQIRQNGVGRGGSLQYTNDANSPATKTVQLSVQTGDVISFVVSYGNRYDYLEDEWIQTITYTSSVSVTANKLDGGTTVDPSGFMPDMEQKEFVKEIMQRYGLVMIQNRFKKTEYLFVQIEDLLNDRANAVDWTDKLIGVASEEYESGYAQTNYFNYQYTADTVPYLDGVLNVSNVNTDKERTVIESAFEIPDISGFSKFIETGSYLLRSFPIYESKDGAIENVETNPKLMRIRRDSTNQTFSFFGTTVSMTDDVVFLTDDNLSWQYFLDNYYVSFGNLLNKFKRVEVEVNLTDIDLYNVDFFRLVYLRQTGRYYYLEGIKTSNKTTATLVEITTFNS